MLIGHLIAFVSFHGEAAEGYAEILKLHSILRLFRTFVKFKLSANAQLI